MARMPDVKEGQEREARLMGEAIEVMAVTRPWIREHGWPDRYDELADRARAGEGDVTRQVKTRGALIRESYESREGVANNVAYFRKGERGQAFLYVQAWSGAA